MTERDAQLHATFSHKFSSFPRRPQCDGIFQQRNINSLRSLCFCPSRAENLQGRYQWAVSFFLFTNFTRSERREISSLRGKRGKKKRKGNPPNRGILDQRLVPEGNHIFREKTTASPFFSHLPWAIATAASILAPPVSHFEREIFSNVQTCFSGDFLAARPRGNDCRRDLIRDW